MADDLLKLEADAQQYIAELGRAVDALNKLYSAQEKTVQQAQTMNSATGQVQSSLSISAGEAGKAAAVFRQVGKEWQLVSANATTFTNGLANQTKNLNAIAAAASRTAIKMGDFTKATAAANLIQSEPLRVKALERVETARVQQPISTEQFTRNLRRGFEQDIAAMPVATKRNFKEIERQFAETAAQLGFTWDQTSKKLKAIQSGKLAIAPEGDVARFQAAGVAYATEIEKIQKTRAKNQADEEAANRNRQNLLRERQLEEKGMALARLEVERVGQILAQQNAAKEEAARVNRAGAIRSLQEEQRKNQEVLRGTTNAQKDYDAFNAKLNSNLLTLTKTTTAYNSETGKSVETLRAVDNSGSAYVATVRRLDGAVKGFTLVSDASVTAAKNAAKAAQDKAAAAKQETLAVQGATQFYGQLGKSMIELTPRTIQNNIATGESIERYRTMNRQGQEVLTTIEKQGNAIKGMTQSTQDQTIANKGLLLSWQSMVRILTVQVLHQAVYSLMNAMQQAVETAKNLQINIALIQTISERGLNVEQWTKGILAVSDATGMLAEDVAKGTYDTLSNQIADGAEALDFMAKAGKFAVTTNSTLQESVNALSSAINSYGLTTKDTTHISDVFFRMIDLGRIQAKDFSNEIGRILPGAQQLGVRLEEVAAVLSTLTRSGVTPAAAMTSLFNIFSRLIKPAGEMKDFLRQLGVASGQAAIQTYGFAQVLAKVAEFAQGKPEILGQLFPDIRGLRGILRLAGDGLKEFNSDLKGMEDAAGATDKALEAFANNTGKRFQIELNKVRNYFTGAFGTTIIENIVKVSDAVGGLSNAVKILVSELTWIGGAVVLTSIARVGASFLAAIFNVELLTLRLSGLTAFLKANPVGLIAAAFATVAGYLAKTWNDEADKFDAMQESLDAFLKKAKESGAAVTEKALKPVDDAINKQSTGLHLLLANITKSYDVMGKELVEQNETIMDSFKEVHETFVNYLSDSLSKLRDGIRETKNTLKDIKTFELTGQMKIDERIRKIRLDDAETAIEKQKLLNQELAITTQEMNKEQNRDKRVALYEKAQNIIEEIHKLDQGQAKEAIKNEKERNKMLDEKRKLEQELVNITKKQEIAELEKRKKIDAAAKKGPITTQDGRIVSPAGTNQNLIEQKDEYGDEQRKQRIEEIKAKLREINAVLKDSTPQYKKQNDLVRDLQKLKEEMLRLDKEQAIAEAARLKELEKQEDDMKQAVKDANEAFKAIEKVKFDKLVDPDTTKAKYDKILEDGNKAIETLSGVTQKFAGKDYEKKVQYEKELAKVKGNLEETAALATKRRAAAELATQINDLNTLQQDKRKKLAEEMNKRRDMAAGLQTTIESYSGDLKEATDYFAKQWRPGVLNPALQEGQRNAVNTMMNLINKIKGGSATTEDVTRLRDMRQAFKSTNAREGVLDEGSKKFIAVVDQILKIAGPLGEQNDKINALTTDINKTVAAIEDMTKVMSEKFGVDLGKLFENSKNINQLVSNTGDIYQALLDGFSGVIAGLSPAAREKALSTELPTVESKKNAKVEVKALTVPEIKAVESVQLPTKPAAAPVKPMPVVITNQEGKQVLTNVPEVIQRSVPQPVTEMKQVIEDQAKKSPLHDGVVVTMPSMEKMLTETAAALKAEDLENKAKAAQVNAKRIADAIEYNGGAFVDSLYKTEQAVNRLSDVILTNVPSNQPPVTVELPPKPYAFGGFVHGSDNIPALLSKGEFVVNSKATRRFYSQLVNMNSMRGFAQGGLVTNNVGDVNVSLASSGNTQTDIVAIGKGLQREIRRGRIRF